MIGVEEGEELRETGIEEKGTMGWKEEEVIC